MDAFVGAEAEHHLLQFGVAGGTNAVRHVGDQAGRGYPLVAGVDADREFGRADIALDDEELPAFDYARDRAQLARRIVFALDPAAGVLFDHRGEALAPIVL